MARLYVIKPKEAELYSGTIATKVLEKLKLHGKYHPSHLYRGIYGSIKCIRAAVKRGTDRSEEGRNEAERKLIKKGIVVAEERDLLDDMTNPESIFVGEEDDLDEIVDNYTEPLDGETHGAILVYDPSQLSQDFSLAQFYRFRTTPKNALVAGVTWKVSP